MGQGGAPTSGAGSQTGSTIPAGRPAFEVVSIHRSPPDLLRFGFNLSPAGRFAATGMTVNGLVSFAYDAEYGTLSGGPGWAESEHFDINAKVEDSLVEARNKLPDKERTDQLRLLIQSLLEDRFQLTIRHERKEIPIYVLVIAKNGPKLTPAPPPPDTEDSGSKTPKGMMLRLTGDGWVVKNITMSAWATQLSGQSEVDRMVVDETGLKGEYDFDLKWSGSRDGSGPALTTALEEQIGLKLEPRKKMVDTIVIGHVERPSEN
jgi:uncharacterized protein (TIGR03435 family)